tara:strand:+ start:514 stop:843 length:330 start_codon:yes stop_codon:yes gene_type:complete
VILRIQLLSLRAAGADFKVIDRSHATSRFVKQRTDTHALPAYSTPVQQITARLAKGTSAGSGKDGLSIHDVEFRADIDMPVFKIGGTSIGTVQFTDFAITDTTMMVYGH